MKSCERMIYHLSVSWRANSLIPKCPLSVWIFFFKKKATRMLRSTRLKSQSSNQVMASRASSSDLPGFAPLLPTPFGAGGLIAVAQRVQSSALSHITSHVFTVAITTVHKTEREYVTNAIAKPIPLKYFNARQPCCKVITFLKDLMNK